MYLYDSRKGGIKKITYTENNAQYHWGVSTEGQWALYNTKEDPGCLQDLASVQAELVSTLSTAYDQWWDEVYPEMIKHGGDQGKFRPLPEPWP